MSLPDIVYVIYIKTTPEKLWDAITSPELTPRYFVGRLPKSDWKVGSDFKLILEDGTLDTQGKVLEADPPRRLVVTWHVEWVDENQHLPEVVVSYDIEPISTVVRLTMTERHPHDIDPTYLEGSNKCWPVILSGLKSLLETGEGLPPFPI
ncbi:MAG: SRPBCC family protein [Capsulimonadaceae bacterium]